MTAQSIQERKHDGENSGPPVSAEAILKGETANFVDRGSLDKIDRVYSMRKTSSSDTTAAQAPEKRSPTSSIATGPWMKDKNDSVPEETQVDAEDILKRNGAVKADSASLDKIDGLPVRTHNSESLAKKSHMYPQL